MFTAEAFSITHRSTGKIDCKLNKKKNVAYFANRQQTASHSIWHSRLGHCSLQTIDFLKSQKHISGSDVMPVNLAGLQICLLLLLEIVLCIFFT